MYDLRNLREMLCKELDDIADKREMSAGDLDALQKLTSSIKNTYKIEMAAILVMESGKRTCVARTAAAAHIAVADVMRWAATAVLTPASICVRN